MKDYYVYILRCADGSYYVGMTNNVQCRLEQHESGLNKDCYTFERRPLTLAYFTSFRDVWDAIHAETVVKAWSRKKKEALIAGDGELLRELARKRFPVRYLRRCNAQYGFVCQSIRFRRRTKVHDLLLSA
jgi:putative endonuclease